MAVKPVLKHRYSMSGLPAKETEKWGRDKADERYGVLRQPDMKPADKCYPQFKQDQRAGNHYDARNSWVRGAGENAENKPGYVPGHKGK